MKLLMTADTVGGVWTYALELARSLQPAGVEVVLATMGAALSPAQWHDINEVSNVQVEQSNYKLEWMDEAWDDVAAAGAWLLALETEHQPDVIHLNGYVHAALPWRAPVLVVAHSCVLSWWQAVRGQPAPPEWDEYRRRVQRGLQAADWVVTPTCAMLEALEQHYGLLANTCVIANRRDATHWYPEAKHNIILAVGRVWDEAKNIAALDAVAPALAWPIYVAGSTRHPDGGAVQPKHLHTLGVLTPAELAAWMRRAAIYALPMRYEPFGLSVLEAALCGCALVLGDVPSQRELWHMAAVFVPPADHAELVTVLQRLIDDQPLRAMLGQHARSRAQIWQTQSMAAAYLPLYQRIMSEIRSQKGRRRWAIGNRPSIS